MPISAQEQAQVAHIAAPPVLDGYLNEEVWDLVDPIASFQRYIPSKGGAPDGDTEVFFLQDEQNLYIGIRVSNTSYQPKARVSPRENINDDDQIGIYIDTVGDGRTGYIFYFNPLGIQQDIRYSNGNWFVEWNTVYQSNGHVTADGYEIEIAIPFRSIRYPQVDSPDWNIMITRKIPDLGSKYAWPEIQRSHPRTFVQAKPLVGIKPPPTSSGVSIQPTLSTLHAFDHQNESWQYREVDSWQERIRPSLDALFGITSDTGVTATINPDFSQIEGDVTQLNLNQRFAFFYPEQRPFFLDNIEFFRDQSSVLYTRSIVDPIYGVKLAGREKGTDFGILHSIDRSPKSSVNEQDTPGFSPEDLNNKWAINSFARSRFDAFQQGYVGLVVADKRIIANPLAPDASPSSAFSNVGGVDLMIPFANVWTASGFSSFSGAGTTDEQLFGNSSKVSISRSPAVGTGGNFNVFNTTENYRKEIGFITQSGNYGGSASLKHSIAYGEGSFWSGNTNVSHLKEYTGNQFSSFSIGQRFNFNGINKLEMNGGPTYIQFSDVSLFGYNASVEWESRVNSYFRYSFDISHGTEIDYTQLIPGRYLNGSFSTTVRPTQGIRFDSSVTYKQYAVEEQAPNFGTNTYNRLTWQISRLWGLRLIHQSTLLSSEDYASHNGSVLLAWLKSPGTESYIGATWTVEEAQVQEQVIFAKYTHLFRL